MIGCIKENEDNEYEKILCRIQFIPKQTIGEKIAKFTSIIKNKVSKENVNLKEVQHAN